MDDTPTIAARLMTTFAQRSGLHRAVSDPRRYLWTDAFAVCNFLELFKETGDPEHQRCATKLVGQVHWVLGRYREDDMRCGWISGHDEQAGGRHPTAGGLRIGKPLQERRVCDPFDEQSEWDRDGQYFHYLTKWMHALCQVAFVTGNSEYARWAVELGAGAFKGFVYRSGAGDIEGVFWKMSTDLSRPLVNATGLHDALDGFITFREAQRTAAILTIAGPELNDLSQAIELLSALCHQRDWTTDDPLGLGMLLFDACRLCQLVVEDRPSDVDLIDDILIACRGGMSALLGKRYLIQPPSQRLAFRELGLSTGLKGLTITADAITRNAMAFRRRTSLGRNVDLLLPYQSLGERIISIWLAHAEQDQSWNIHRDINDVMLATALVPGTFLLIDQRD